MKMGGGLCAQSRGSVTCDGVLDHCRAACTGQLANAKCCQDVAQPMVVQDMYVILRTINGAFEGARAMDTFSARDADFYKCLQHMMLT